ncbi:hypothetical protein N7456_004125 [Penicillium angulare]|uniref:Uncharacterized protein n=1 Tax=Penicillium angulare TaxID=116970 RepID=A0A9W9FWT0_9EURO|nr:hypothetical protein N7456_004125 [Penicillium angulare]
MSKPKPTRRLLIFHEGRTNTGEVGYTPINKLGLPICGDPPEMPSILELPLRTVTYFTDLFNLPKYKGWAILGAGPYRDASEEGKFYAVVLEQLYAPHVQGHQGHQGHQVPQGHVQEGSRNEAMRVSPEGKS